MRIVIPFLVVLSALTFSTKAPSRAAQIATAASAGNICGPSGTTHVRTTLYFGLSHPTGSVNDAQWRTFLRDEVTPRFPDGLTVWEANGQWRRPDGKIARERAKVLLLVHNETNDVRSALVEIVAKYKEKFRQESVLWESAPVCAAF